MIEYKVITEISKNSDHTQRTLAEQFDVSLGKINYILSGFMRIGAIQAKKVRDHHDKIRWRYYLTPKGMKDVVEHARATLGAANQDFLRNFYARIFQVESDAQGRIVLPAPMKAAVGIGQDVVFIGANRRVELWAPEKWQQYEKQHAAEYQQKLGAVVKDVFGL